MQPEDYIKKVIADELADDRFAGMHANDVEGVQVYTIKEWRTNKHRGVDAVKAGLKFARSQYSLKQANKYIKAHQ